VEHESKEKKKDKSKESEVVDPVKAKLHMEVEQSCSGCPLECTDHPSYPKSILQNINWSEDLDGTTKRYKKHFMLCLGTDPAKWKKTMNDESPYYKAFAEHWEPFGKKSRLNGIDVPTAGVEHLEEGGCDVLVFPDKLKYKQVKIDQIADFLETILVKKTAYTGVPSEKLERKSYVFVCAHKLRDKRCGVSGPILIDEFGKSLREHHLEKDVQVTAISHVGGHAFAGNVIIFPEGTWYGRVMPCHVHALVEKHLINKEILKPLVRGSIEVEKEDQKEQR